MENNFDQTLHDLAVKAGFDPELLRNDPHEFIRDVLSRIIEIRNETEEIRAGRELLNTVIENIPYPVYVKDVSGRKIFLNQAEADLLNTSVQDALGRKDEDFYPPDIAEATRKEDNLVIQHNKPLLNKEGFILTREGKEIWFEGNKIPYLDKDGKVVGLVGISLDISLRKEAEKQLARMLQLQQLIAGVATEFINVPIDEIDEAVDKLLSLSGKGTLVDRVYIFGYDFAGRTMSNTHEWCAGGVSSELENLQSIPMEILPSWVETHSRGELLTVPDVGKLSPGDPLRTILEPQGIKTLVTVPMILKNECIGFVGFDSVKSVKVWSSEEVTVLRLIADLLCNALDRKRTEHDLIAATKEAQAANILKTRFLANMSHEIRTPLNAIIGMVRLLIESRVEEPQMKLLNNMKTSSETLLGIVNDILDFSKIESGQLEIENTVFNLQELLRKVYDANEYKAEEKGLKFSCLTDQSVSEYIQGDPVHLQQVLTNLVSNAIKFTSEGKVEVRYELTGIVEGRERVLFTVVDTGIGISQENQSKIFQSFQQEDESVTRKYGGTGLGLAISKQLVELMGGTLLVESEKNTGSRFYFTIEFEPGQAGIMDKQEKPGYGKTLSIEGTRVLLVEDNKFNQFIAQALMEKWKARTTICDDGQQAVEILRKEKFDLILMDLQMPVMDGITAAGVIRKELKLSTPILALTANVVMGIVERCESAGMQGYISKPFEEEELFMKIREVLGHDESLIVSEPVAAVPKDLCDISRLVKMVSNDQKMLNKMIEKFLEVTPEYSRDLQKASSDRDVEAVGRISHKIKSAIDLVAADEVKNLIKQINDLSKTGNQNEELYTLTGKFLEYFGTLTDQLREMLTVKR